LGREWAPHATGLVLLQLPWQNVNMSEKESDNPRPQREADRRKRQAAALKANIKRRKNPSEADKSSDSEENDA
jgi:hypothetical protein